MPDHNNLVVPSHLLTDNVDREKHDEIQKNSHYINIFEYINSIKL